MIRGFLAGLVLGAMAAWWWLGSRLSNVGCRIGLRRDDEAKSVEYDPEQPLPPYDPHIGELVRWN